MSKIEEVKAKIRSGDIEEAMAIAMSEAMKLEIVTTVNNEENHNQIVSCRSLIDLLQNEIDHELGDSQNVKQIQNNHFQEVEKSHKRILQNVQSLQKMFTLLQENADKLS
ncbi:MAG: hypothetical protein GW795_05130 [Cyanobacteria bacterium]|uniref:hypothetical protein n=1 Tax=Geminocystis sp. TaxID=2664100 RepID=UPI001DBA8C2B|nr:hypothetical protein [Cyanobacteria bacterium CG_2015-16_32_12]NCO79190.1 hypothetical protein [Cyanobacteria bacterium CG_2015-22_32_23]NCQ04932.1 hypothetical protein [Cyanobacteria bacterium CG_2015-09_32_10]NCQ41269.1 hypothetical protein [Cyanobacteria bacterium CG_2015-04_32_10]NCS84091.1 hypothetical protein [Cyanobacteria bacterium CG_2015-02_32_10]